MKDSPQSRQVGLPSTASLAMSKAGPAACRTREQTFHDVVRYRETERFAHTVDSPVQPLQGEASVASPNRQGPEAKNQQD